MAVLLTRRAAVVCSSVPVSQCYLYKSDSHKVLARELKRRSPELVLCSYGGKEYYGETILHIAIVNKDIDEVEYLAKHFPALLSIRATGDFFQVGKPCYYGAWRRTVVYGLVVFCGSVFRGQGPITRQQPSQEPFQRVTVLCASGPPASQVSVFFTCVFHRLPQASTRCSSPRARTKRAW